MQAGRGEELPQPLQARIHQSERSLNPVLWVFTEGSLHRRDRFISHWLLIPPLASLLSLEVLKFSF